MKRFNELGLKFIGLDFKILGFWRVFVGWFKDYKDRLPHFGQLI
jgi:hypothetical protein